MSTTEINFLEHIKEVNVEKPSDIIINQLKELISKGVLKPGYKLPPERVLAQSFGVGRGHIRQALKKLEFYGILETYPQDGTYVAGLGVKAIEGLIKNVLKLNDNDFKSLVETRAILEIEAIKLTCQRANREQLQEIEEAHLDFAAKVRENETGLEEDLIFHLKIAEFCQNSVLYSMITLLTPEMLKLSHEKKSCKSNRFLEALVEHEKIIAGLKTHDPEICVQAMKAHMDKTMLSLEN
jgi:GntR family transcriptional repressor for pyruvate dehydrogenase complex